MTPELKSIAARIREFISRQLGRKDSFRDTKEEFNRLALELFAQQFVYNAPYRRLCESRGVSPASVEDWTRIPAVPAVAFKEFELTCIEPRERTAVFYSSGTTEQRRSRHFHSAESLALYEASLWSWFERNVLGAVEQTDDPAQCVGGAAKAKGLQFMMLTPPPSQAPNSSLVHMFQTVGLKFKKGDDIFYGGLDAEGGWTLDHPRAEASLRAAVLGEKPLVVLGTAFNFVHLLDDLVSRKLKFELPRGSVVMETGGYKGRSREMPKAELHALIARTLGVPRSNIICEYGMSELSSQAYDNISSRDSDGVARLFRFPPWARAQIISPETGREVADGETGLIRIFDLANAFSVPAVQTEDLALRRGDGFELIGRAVASEARGCSLMTA